MSGAVGIPAGSGSTQAPTATRFRAGGTQAPARPRPTVPRALPALALALLAAAGLAQAAPTHADRAPDGDRASLLLTADEQALARELSPLPPPPPSPTNARADDPAAARLGQALFFDARLSLDGTVSCASCHDPGQGWSDGRRLARGVAHHNRHAMTLWNVAYNRWFFWDGRKDSLWSQALAPLEDPREHATSRLAIAHLLAGDAGYRRAWVDVFGPLPDLSDGDRFPPEGRPVPGDPAHPQARAWASMAPADRALVDDVFVGVGKALEAYQRQLVTRRAPFDVFVEGLEDGDPDKLAALSPAAQRGFALFVGPANCLVCHDGPTFSDGEFHSNRVPTGEGSDPGRGLGVLRLLEDPFNGASRFADDGGAQAASKLNLPPAGWEQPGAFKTPTLRNVTTHPPYMHEGQLDSLEAVIAFYSSLEGAAPLGPHSERLMVEPLDLTAEEQADLLAFLQALTDTDLPQALLGPPPTPWLP